MERPTTANERAIEALIPHRPPFRFVDRVLRVSADVGELELELDADDPRLTNGRLQPLLLIEALAQATAAFHGAQLAAGAEAGVLVELSDARLLDAARAGERVTLRVERQRVFGDLARFWGTATAGSRPLAETRVTVLRRRGEAS